ncbi:D-3-phosphoglycerate dehydrogenase [Anseongella ginsenosidimutans]|uniref:D-3-phosphoglycerate dehydrogenase n=1 Tax=Anseongella ginsenosidimutans TaxID=496056 RepID=A0A4R3KQZ2_9SPHI|nr:2-hydroxyacid dehydrogenase [Anseongella ginsenosidimutans]QEC53754.1 hydroxyacid dehydrogenase [Anseongella ginsenosidimutans]TCS85988.1 D-3-phosphoglycerate dehydrogenase [Anseongella ginsenosidimutans]
MRILVTAPYNENGLKELENALGEVIYKPWKPHGRAYNEEELLSLLKDTAAEALITEHDHVTRNVIGHFPELKFIGVCRGTPSNVSLETAAEKNIPVFHTPARNAQAVAEMFLANVITLIRNTLPAHAWLTGGNWEEGAHTSYLEFKGNELAGKTIGMVGFGAIGQLIARLVSGFPCPIRFYDPFVTTFDPAFQKLSLEEVFSGSDIVSVHLPVTSETRGMIGADLINRMRPGAIFVNTARAVVVQREALLDALENGRIRGAVLDVFDHEPPDEIDYRIIRHPRVLATPHIAGATHEVEDHHVNILNKQLLAIFSAKTGLSQ